MPLLTVQQEVVARLAPGGGLGLEGKGRGEGKWAGKEGWMREEWSGLGESGGKVRKAGRVRV